MLKKNLKLPKNPIARNVVVIIGVIGVVLAIALLASLIRFLVGWVISLGWKYLLTIAITALLCGVIFGYVDMKKNDDYDEQNLQVNQTSGLVPCY